MINNKNPKTPSKGILVSLHKQWPPPTHLELAREEGGEIEKGDGGPKH